MQVSSSSDLERREDEKKKALLSTNYIDIQWLTTFGLTKQTVMDYFYTSPFFNEKSNNQQIRLQGVEADRHQAILSSMTGIEYSLDEMNTQEPNLFVIREQERMSPSMSDVNLLNVYYIMDGIIYQCPDLLALLKSRIGKASYYLTDSFKTIKATMEQHHNQERLEKNEKKQAAASGSSSSAEDQQKKPKYSKHLRDFPSFKTVLMDCHGIEF